MKAAQTGEGCQDCGEASMAGVELGHMLLQVLLQLVVDMQAPE